MITTPKGRKNRIRRLLVRWGGGTPTTGALERFPSGDAGEILRRAGLAADEEPLLVHLPGTGNWYLLTTERLIWWQDEVLRALPWPDVREVQQRPVELLRLILGHLAKLDFSDLEVFDPDDVRYILRLGSGESYYLVWSGINALCNHTRAPDLVQFWGTSG